jgi:hypothetical protein
VNVKAVLKVSVRNATVLTCAAVSNKLMGFGDMDLHAINAMVKSGKEEARESNNFNKYEK